MEVASGGSLRLISSSLCMYYKRNDSGSAGHGTFGQGPLWWRQSATKQQTKYMHMTSSYKNVTPQASKAAVCLRVGSRGF